MQRGAGGLQVGVVEPQVAQHEVAADGQAIDPPLVLLLVHGPEATVVGALVSVHHVLQLFFIRGLTNTDAYVGACLG